MLLSRHQNAGQNHYIEIGNRWSENVAQFRYFGTTITNENLSQEEINPSAWRFKFRCRFSCGTFFSPAFKF
jgi:hypothetical protein